MYKVTFKAIRDSKQYLEFKSPDYDKAKYFFIRLCNELNTGSHFEPTDITFYGKQEEILARYLWN